MNLKEIYMENKTPFMTEIPEQEPQRQQYFMAHAKEQLHILTWADLLPAVLIPLAAR